MDNNQNQGASIEAASRAEFEAEVRDLDLPADSLARWPDGRYLQEPIESMWSGWQMARRAPAAQVGAGELPPLPDALVKIDQNEDGNWGEIQPNAWGSTYAFELDIDAPLFTAEQLKDYARAAIEADRAQLVSLKAAFDAAVSLAGETIEARNAEIADLRAQLAQQGQGDGWEKLTQWGAAGISVGWQHDEEMYVKVSDLRALYAAPASAQPADPKAMTNAEAAAWARQNGLNVPPQWEAGAQPDQRESAAEITVDWPPCNLACDPAEGSNGRNRHCSCDAAKASIARQIAASPAAQRAKDEQIAAVQEAYGYLWHVNAAYDAPPGIFPVSLTPESAAYKARRVLRELLTHEQRGQGINAAREALQAQASANNGADEQKSGAK